ncbi:MAG: hypothetical protein ACI4FY_08675 [Acetatifactor sp.]
MARRIRMKDRSIISPLECLTGHLLLGFLVGYVYRDFVFRPIGSLSEKTSAGCFYALLIGFSLLGTIVRWRKCMSAKATVTDSLVGVGIYSMLAYFSYFWLAAVAVVLSIIALIYYEWEMLPYEVPRSRKFAALPGKVKRSYLLRRSAVRLYHSVSMCIAFLAVCMMIPLCFFRLKYGSSFVVFTYKEVSVEGFDLNYKKSSDSLDSLYDTISKIRFEETWSPLTVTERLEVVQTICDCERNYWGIDYPIVVETEDMRANTLGHYDDRGKKIVLNSTFLAQGSAPKVLEVTLHEMYHAVEYRLVRLYLNASESEKKMRIFMYCREYLQEMNDYKHGTDTPEGFQEYYGQYMEKQARAYSESAMAEYYAQLDEICAERLMEDYEEDVKGAEY